MKLLQCLLYVALIGVASHFIGLAMPREWFDPDSSLFRRRHWEENGELYRRLNIRAWKDKLPDTSKVVKTMYTKQVSTHPDETNLQRMIQETCVAEFIHLLLIVLSLGVTRIWKGKNGWICWILCILGNLPFILIQRFNRPRLRSALERIKAKKVAPQN